MIPLSKSARSLFFPISTPYRPTEGVLRRRRLHLALKVVDWGPSRARTAHGDVAWNGPTLPSRVIRLIVRANPLEGQGVNGGATVTTQAPKRRNRNLRGRVPIDKQPSQ